VFLAFKVLRRKHWKWYKIVSLISWKHFESGIVLHISCTKLSKQEAKWTRKPKQAPRVSLVWENIICFSFVFNRRNNMKHHLIYCNLGFNFQISIGYGENRNFFVFIISNIILWKQKKVKTKVAILI
jgi:hypothetical protein